MTVTMVTPGQRPEWELPILKDAAEKFRKLYERKNLSLEDTDTLIDTVQEDLCRLYIDEHYLLVVSIASPWYSKDHVLCEELVYAYGSGTSDLSRVVEVMELVAQEQGCTAIMAGSLAASTETRHYALAAQYKACGMVLDSMTLIRRI